MLSKSLVFIFKSSKNRYKVCTYLDLLMCLVIHLRLLKINGNSKCFRKTQSLSLDRAKIGLKYVPRFVNVFLELFLKALDMTLCLAVRHGFGTVFSSASIPLGLGLIYLKNKGFSKFLFETKGGLGTCSTCMLC